MSGNVTAGIYLGTPPADPNAEIRKIFTERENQQDGLGTILSYCQKEAGFTIGSTDTEGFRQQLRTFGPVLWLQDSSIMMPMQDNKDAVIAAILTFADRVPDKSQCRKFASEIVDNMTKSFVQFCVQQDGDYLALFLTKVTVQGNSQNMIGVCAYDIWAVNRGEMASRADELVDKLKLKDGLGEWVKKVSSPGYAE
ncbi:hypothetical protein KI688_005718 [Linnemannia hyalina]|uniref:Uncharacterized protein n=1 Tax=Linnemannia hyalina TaxID=64524 RepID=A0A9P7Y557_9FUNG|nr:hypothetical protein KI688_005718 [Linnemannia hyalina]